MSHEFEPRSIGPGRLLGGLSLGCFLISLIVVAVAAFKVSDIVANAPPAGGGAQAFFGSGLVILIALLVVGVSSFAGLVFGVAGLLLALTRPNGRPILPALGFSLNLLPLLAVVFLRLYKHL